MSPTEIAALADKAERQIVLDKARKEQADQKFWRDWAKQAVPGLLNENRRIAELGGRTHQVYRSKFFMRFIPPGTHPWDHRITLQHLAKLDYRAHALCLELAKHGWVPRIEQGSNTAGNEWITLNLDW